MQTETVDQDVVTSLYTYPVQLLRLLHGQKKGTIYKIYKSNTLSTNIGKFTEYYVYKQSAEDMESERKGDYGFRHPVAD